MRAIAFALLFVSASGMAQDFNYLKRDEQKYFSNDSQDGKNTMERIDANVREINRLHSVINQLKQELAQVRMDVEELKKKK